VHRDKAALLQSDVGDHGLPADDTPPGQQRHRMIDRQVSPRVYGAICHDEMLPESPGPSAAGPAETHAFPNLNRPLPYRHATPKPHNEKDRLRLLSPRQEPSARHRRTGS
jgi:hypothetical protein